MSRTLPFSACGAVLVALLTAASQPGDADRTLTIEDLWVEGADPGYREACELFLKAKVSDHGKARYGDAVAALRKASQGATSPEVKLRCLFLIAFSHLLEGQGAQALAACREARVVAGKAPDWQALAAKLEKVETEIKIGKLSNLGAVSTSLGLGKEAAGLIGDLARLHEARRRYEEKLERRWQRHEQAMEAVVAEWSRSEGLTPEQTNRLRAALRGKYRPKGFVILSEVEDVLVKFSLDELTK